MMYVSPPHNQIRGWTDILQENFGYITDGFFVEVGAFDGKWWSPSYTLSVAGWGGIFFEPQTRVWNKLNANHGDNPAITCVKKALSDYVGKAELHLGGSVSTIRQDTRDMYMKIPEFQSTGLGTETAEIVVVSTLDLELLSLDAPVGFEVLTIDVEGSEVDVLNGFTVDTWQPQMIVIEAHEKFYDAKLSSKADEINAYMETAGYSKIYSDHINNIYMRRQDGQKRMDTAL